MLIQRRPGVGYLDTNLWVPKIADVVNVQGVKNALTFQTFEKKEITFFTLYKETEHHLIVPREFWDPSSFDFPVIDCRPRSYACTNIRSRIQLDHEVRNGVLVPNGKRVQRDAMSALIHSRGGILQLACGAGKTVVTLDLIATERVPTLIILDTNQLIEQWTEAINMFLDIPEGLGLIRGDVYDWKKPVVLTTYHTLAARAATMTEEVRRWFGRIVWDEAHHVAAPTFSRSADLFYGKRTGLTATPTRDDGTHVVYDFHIGPVIYKNLTQDLKPRIYFIWTGLTLDYDSKIVSDAIRDKNGELHLGKIAGHFGQWRPRLDFVLSQVQEAVSQGRKIIVLSKSVDELVNLFALWSGMPDLYTDIPFPMSAEVGETALPIGLDETKPHPKADSEHDKVRKSFFETKNKLEGRSVVDPKVYVGLQDKFKALEMMLIQHEVFKKCESLWNKRRGQYLKDLLARPSTAGLMIHAVKPKQARDMLKARQVTFAISKYGREGLDEKSLDTIIVCEPLSSRNALQQLMGRVLRDKEGKKEPVVVFLEDNIGPFIGMCKKLRQELREWPPDEGGPFHYEMIGHPLTKGKEKNTWKQQTIRV